MDIRHELEMLHKEHEEILRFLDAWEDTLVLAASDEYTIRWRGLKQLQGMTAEIAEICEHCRREEEDADSPLFLFLEDAARTQLRDEHVQLQRANYEFRHELEFTTASLTGDLCLQGRHLLAALRQHIVYEEGLLKRIADDRLSHPDALKTMTAMKP